MCLRLTRLTSYRLVTYSTDRQVFFTLAMPRSKRSNKPKASKGNNDSESQSSGHQNSSGQNKSSSKSVNSSNHEPHNEGPESSQDGHQERSPLERKRKNPLINGEIIKIERADGSNAPGEEPVFFGYYEFQALGHKATSSNDVQMYKENCSKSAEHTHFKPIHTFSKHDLLEGFQDDDHFEHIQATADLTVCVENEYISPTRSIFHPFCHEPYPLYETNGGELTRLGTGRIWFIIKYSKDDTRQCLCKNCRVLNEIKEKMFQDQHYSEQEQKDKEASLKEIHSPKKAAGEIWVHTAHQVVGNREEAQRTTCRLFYDSPDSEDVNIYGSGVVESDREGDKCMLKCMTCDAELLERLEGMLKRWRKTCAAVHDKCMQASDVGNMAVIVSHPHGGPKQVSVGEWTHRMIRSTMYNTCDKYAYTTSTCPGCSGAPVFIAGLKSFRFGNFIHSGTSYKSGETNLNGVANVTEPEFKVVNFSGRGRYYSKNTNSLLL